MNDFAALDKYSNVKRKAFVEQSRVRLGLFSNNGSQFEAAYVALPNPMYGAWENGLYDAKAFGRDSIWKLTAAEKNQQRRQSLLRWANP